MHYDNDNPKDHSKPKKPRVINIANTMILMMIFKKINSLKEKNKKLMTNILIQIVAVYNEIY